MGNKYNLELIKKLEDEINALDDFSLHGIYLNRDGSFKRAEGFFKNKDERLERVIWDNEGNCFLYKSGERFRRGDINLESNDQQTDNR